MAAVGVCALLNRCTARVEKHDKRRLPDEAARAGRGRRVQAEAGDESEAAARFADDACRAVRGQRRCRESAVRPRRAKQQSATRPSSTRHARRTVGRSNFSSPRSQVPAPSRAPKALQRHISLVASLAEAVWSAVSERKGEFTDENGRRVRRGGKLVRSVHCAVRLLPQSTSRSLCAHQPLERCREQWEVKRRTSSSSRAATCHDPAQAAQLNAR